mgnify:CR=1 FL=1
MTELQLDKDQFDVIWAEGSAYIMGVEKALKTWKPLLKANGFVVFSDMVWLTDEPSEDAVEHWKSDYPDIQTVGIRTKQIKKAGYELEQSFTLSERGWQNYYEPLQARLEQLKPLMKNSQAIEDIQREIDISTSRFGEFGYQFFIARKHSD